MLIITYFKNNIYNIFYNFKKIEILIIFNLYLYSYLNLNKIITIYSLQKNYLFILLHYYNY